MGLDPVVTAKRQEILRIVSSHGGRRVRIFGSAARGERTSASDFDVLITLGRGRNLLDIVAIKQDLEDILGRTVDVVTESSISPYMRDEILAEAVEL